MRWPSIEDLSQFGADWAVDFGGNLVLELGPGTGTFTISLAKAFPRNFHVLIDMNYKNAARIVARLKNEKIKNVGIVCGFAHSELASISTDISFKTIYSHFASPENVHGEVTPRIYGKPTCEQIIRLTSIGSEFLATSDRKSVIRAFQNNLKPYFVRQDWNLAIPPLRKDTIVGTDMEWKFCKRLEAPIQKIHLVRE